LLLTGDNPWSIHFGAPTFHRSSSSRGTFLEPHLRTEKAGWFPTIGKLSVEFSSANLSASFPWPLRDWLRETSCDSLLPP
jgi:hypothetical protein